MLTAIVNASPFLVALIFQSISSCTQRMKCFIYIYTHGAIRLSPNEIESKALQLAKNNKKLNLTDISILHLPCEDIEDSSSYEVDVQIKRLIKKKSG